MGIKGKEQAKGEERKKGRWGAHWEREGKKKEEGRGKKTKKILSKNRYRILYGHASWGTKKNSHMGVFFCFYCVSRKYLYFNVIGDNIYP